MTLLEQFQADAAFYLLNILGFSVVVLMTWLLTKRSHAKALAALEQQQKANNATAQTTFASLQEQIDYEREYLRRTLQLLEQALLKEEVPVLRQQRQLLIQGLMTNYRPKVASMTQLWMHYYQNNKSQQQALAEHTLVPFLETFRQVTAAINAKAVLQALPQDIPVDQAFVGEQTELDFAFQALVQAGKKKWAKQYQKALKLELAPAA